MMVLELVSVMTPDPDAELKVVESVPELIVLFNADDDAGSVIASVPVAEKSVVESVPGGNENE